MKHKKYLIWVLTILGLIVLCKFINKDSLMWVINQSLPPQEAGLLAGMILGEKAGFERGFYQELKRSGIVHLVVVSGSNVVLIAGSIIEGLAKFIGRKRSIILGLFLVWNYVALVGGEVPVIRAALLISIFYWAQILGRKYNLVRSLILVALIMIVSDYQMIFGVSFWLSFGAFIAIVLKPNEEKGWFLNDIKMALWVSLWITPILALSFGEISLISFLTNALVVGLVEIVTIVGGLGTIMGVFNLFLGKVLLFLIYPLLKYIVVVTEILGSLGWAGINFKFNWWLLLGWYLILGRYLWKKKNEI